MSRQRHRESGPEVDLPVTPMLDMAFQLLTFFVFTYHPSALEGQLELALAHEGPSPAASLLQPVSITVRTPHNDYPGAISQLTVETPAGPITVAGLPGLRRYLQGLRQDAYPPQSITVRADLHLKYACLMEVVDTCRQAGFDTVGFGVPPDLDD